MAESSAFEAGAGEVGPAYSLPFAPDQVPDFIDRLTAHLRETAEPQTFFFEGSEIETASRDVRFVELNAYVSREDSAVPAPQRDVTPDSEAFRELERRAMLVAKSITESWGVPRVYTATVGRDGEPASPLDAVLAAEYRASADWWERDGHLFALCTGWIAGSMAGVFAQTLFVMPEGSASSDSLTERSYEFQTSEGHPEMVAGTNAGSLGNAFGDYFFDRGEESTAYRVTDSATQEYVIVDPPRGLVVRADIDRMQFLRRDPATRWTRYVDTFFRGGYDGLDEYEGWVEDQSLMEPFSGAPGSATASDVRVEPDADAAALHAVAADPDVNSAVFQAIGQSWADSGADDETGDYCVLFESTLSEEYVDERAALLELLSVVGYQPAEAPSSASSGEVWVRYDDRLRSEIDKWA